MRSKKYLTKGYVIATKNYSEADKIVILLTPDLGVLPLVAKGARKIKSKKRSHVAQFNLISFSAVRTKGLDIITETQLISSPLKDSNLKILSVAYYLSEVVGKLVKEEDESSGAFEIFGDYLEKIKDGSKLKSKRMSFTEEILKERGYWPKDKSLANPEELLKSVVERQLYSKRVGKKLFE